MKNLFMPSKLAYVVVREELDGPIIQSQVIDLLSNIAQRKSEQIFLVWFYRIDYLFRRGTGAAKARNDLRAKGIKLVAMPFISLGFPVSWYLLPFVLPQWLLGLLWVVSVKDIRILHCRSYHAALTGACLKCLLQFKFVFDPRSPFPEENVAAKRWKEGGVNYQAWKSIEKWIYRKSDAVIAISNPFSETIKTISPGSHVVMIPNNYPVAFAKDKNIRFEVDKNSTIIKICYVGSFGHWNRPESYLQFLSYAEKDKAFAVGMKFIVQPRSKSFLYKSLDKCGIDRAWVTVLSAEQENVIHHMSDCLVGIQIMSRPDDRLSIKFVEYLAAGLPVIVSENVRGAADMVRRHQVGFVLKGDFSNQREALEFIRNVSKDRVLWRDKCQELARELFSCGVVSRQLEQLYETV